MAEVNRSKNQISTKCTATTNQQMVSTEFTWIIRNFELCPEQLGEYIMSPSFRSDQLTDVVWRLKIYPSGRAYDGYVSLMLQLVSCGKQEHVFASCKFAVMDAHGKENFIHEKELQKFIPESEIGFIRLCTTMQLFTQEESEDVEKSPSKPGVLGQHSEMLGNDIIIRCEVNAIGRSELPIKTYFHPADGEISAHLSRLLETGSLSDFFINVGAVKYPVHKAILAARSSYFLAMLEADKNGEVAEVEGVSPDTVYEMLKFIYTGKVELLKENAEDLLRLAQRFRLDGLKTRCEKALSRILTLENAIHMLTFADDHIALELKNNAMQLVGAHAKEICRTEEWKSLAGNKPHLVEELLQALIISESQVSQDRRA